MGVDSNIIDKYTVYSMETAVEMAKHISEYTNSNYGIGITGKINREDPNNTGGSINTIYVCI
jgi:nicotinamide mononucleotide (NMN) deamidase PncC